VEAEAETDTGNVTMVLLEILDVREKIKKLKLGAMANCVQNGENTPTSPSVAELAVVVSDRTQESACTETQETLGVKDQKLNNSSVTQIHVHTSVNGDHGGNVRNHVEREAEAEDDSVSTVSREKMDVWSHYLNLIHAIDKTVQHGETTVNGQHAL